MTIAEILTGEITSKNLYDGLVKLCADYIEKK